MQNLLDESYAELGLSHGATHAEIKRAFKELAFQYHPDRNPHNPEAEHRFKKIAAAYAYLSGNQELYKAVKTAQSSRSQDSRVFIDLFDELFGIENADWVVPGKEIQQKLELSLEEAFLGVSKKLKLLRETFCVRCHGKGTAKAEQSPTCSYCFGLGVVSVKRPGGQVEKNCPHCLGLGRIPKNPCPVCRGRGVSSKEQEITVDIPAKVQDQQILRFPGLGSLAAQSVEPGDLVLEIVLLPHEIFTFDGPDLLCEVFVTSEQLEKGATIDVPTLLGTRQILVPERAENPSLFRMTGLGLGGDQYVRVLCQDWLPEALPAAGDAGRALVGAQPLSGVTIGAKTPSFWSKIKRLISG